MEKFKIGDVHGEVACDVPVNLGEVKEFVKGRVEFSNVRDSIEYIKVRNLLAKEAENRKVDFVGYTYGLMELSAYKHVTLGGEIATENMIHDYEFTDKFAATHHATITLKTELIPEPLLTRIEVYRRLGFNLKDERTVRCLKRRINKDQHQNYNTPEEFIEWMGRHDLSKGLPMVGDIEKTVNEKLDEFEPVVDEVESLQMEIKKYVRERVESYRSRAIDQPESPSGYLLSDENPRNALNVVLDEIENESIEMEREIASEPPAVSIFERIRDAIHHSEGTVFVGEEKV